MANDAPTTDAGTDASATDFAELLETERTTLLRQLAELGFGDAGGLTYDANFADSSQVTAERGEAETLAGQLRDQLTEVEAAINRLTGGTYGQCERCGQPIAPARLEAMPAARLCMACASRP
jgi:RNA polymerase-binding transcription factor DksA